MTIRCYCGRTLEGHCGTCEHPAYRPTPGYCFSPAEKPLSPEEISAVKLTAGGAQNLREACQHKRTVSRYVSWPYGDDVTYCKDCGANLSHPPPVRW